MKSKNKLFLALVLSFRIFKSEAAVNPDVMRINYPADSAGRCPEKKDILNWNVNK